MLSMMVSHQYRRKLLAFLFRARLLLASDNHSYEHMYSISVYLSDRPGLANNTVPDNQTEAPATRFAP